MNITPEPVKWFDLVTACGLTDVHAISLQQMLERLIIGNGIIPTAIPAVRDVAKMLIPRFEAVYDRRIVELSEPADGADGEADISGLRELVYEAEEEARKVNQGSGGWAVEPDLSKRVV
jgi:hypothetical protein